MQQSWLEVGMNVRAASSSHVVWRGPRFDAHDRSSVGIMAPDHEELISRNLARFLHDNLQPGQEAELAINPELRHVLVFVDGELALTCGFEELLAGPGVSPN